MNKLIPALALTALAALPANAAPTYLTCSLVDTQREVAGKVFEPSGIALPVELTLNEEQQTASYYLPSTGLTQRVSATFQRDVITCKNKKTTRWSVHSDQWSLDRVQGVLTRRSVQLAASMIPGQAPTKLLDISQSGKCSKAAAPERMF